MGAILAFLAGPTIGKVVELANSLITGKENVEMAELQQHAEVLKAAYQLMATRAGQFVLIGFAFPIIFFMNKVVVYDICLGLGTTPEPKGYVAGLMLTVTSFVLGHGLINTWKSR